MRITSVAALCAASLFGVTSGYSISFRREEHRLHAGSNPSAEWDRTYGCGSARNPRHAEKVNDVVAIMSSSSSIRVRSSLMLLSRPSRRYPVAISASFDSASNSSPANLLSNEPVVRLVRIERVDHVIAVAPASASRSRVRTRRNRRSGPGPASGAPSARRNGATRAACRSKPPSASARDHERSRRSPPVSAEVLSNPDTLFEPACGHPLWDTVRPLDFSAA